MENIYYLIKFWNKKECILKIIVKKLFHDKNCKSEICGIDIIKIIVNNDNKKIKDIEIFEYHEITLSNLNFIGLEKIKKVESECNFPNIKFH